MRERERERERERSLQKRKERNNKIGFFFLILCGLFDWDVEIIKKEYKMIV